MFGVLAHSHMNVLQLH